MGSLNQFKMVHPARYNFFFLSPQTSKSENDTTHSLSKTSSIVPVAGQSAT